MAEPQQAPHQHLQRRHRLDALRPASGAGRLFAAVTRDPAKHIDRRELVEPEQIIARIPIPGALAGQSAIRKRQPIPRLGRSRRESVVVQVLGRQPLALALGHFNSRNQTIEQPL